MTAGDGAEVLTAWLAVRRALLADAAVASGAVETLRHCVDGAVTVPVPGSQNWPVTL